MYKYLMWPISTTMILGSLVAQQRAEGVVYDRATSEPVEGVNIVAGPSGAGTSTDEGGRFSLEISPSDSVLVAEHIAYERSVVAVSETASDLRIGLDQKIIPLTELDVMGETGRGEFSRLDTKNMVTDIKVNDISIRGYSDIGDVLLNEELVLVSESSTGAKTLSIRGARQEEMVYMHDGVKMHNGGRRSLDLSVFDIGGLETVEVLRGSHERANGSSGTINFVPELAYRTRANFYQRFGTYNTGSYHTGVSLGNKTISFEIGTGRGMSRQFYENADDADISRKFTNNYLSAGYRVFANTELKFYQIQNSRVYHNHYTSDSTESSLRVNTLKLEQDGGRLGDLRLYVSSQRATGEDGISQLQTERDDIHLVTGASYRLPLDNAYLEFYLDRSLIAADWTTSAGDISLEREHLSLSGSFGLTQKKTKNEFEIKDFILNINTNIIEDNTGIESNILTNMPSWQETGATATVSAWDYLNNTIIYVYANTGNSFRVPSISERYAHALRPQTFAGDTLLTEYKMMKEVGLKLSTRDPDVYPVFSGSMSYFHYGYSNKIKTIQYSGTPLQFPVNDGPAEISGVELNAKVYTFGKRLGFRSIYSLYNFSDQLTFPMQPSHMGRHHVMVNLGPVSVRIGIKNEGSRILTTINSSGALTDNYLKQNRSLDLNISCRLRFRDLVASVAIFGQNLDDDSQTLDGVSIFDKRVYLSIGLEWK